jgi:hypothetical protein
MVAAWPKARPERLMPKIQAAMFFMCCSVQGAKKGLWPGLHGILKMGAVKRLMQINSGLAFCWGGLGSSKTLQTEPLCMKLIQLKSVGPHAEKMAALPKETP